MEREVDPRRLYWLGPATIVAAVLAVWAARQLLIAILPPLPEWSGGILTSIESEVLTGVLVTGAVFMFSIVVEIASRPVRTFRRIALAVLIVSCVPNLGGQAYNPIIDWGLSGLTSRVVARLKALFTTWQALICRTNATPCCI